MEGVTLVDGFIDHLYTRLGYYTISLFQPAVSALVVA
jgi:hypothetical protein